MNRSHSMPRVPAARLHLLLPLLIWAQALCGQTSLTTGTYTGISYPGDVSISGSVTFVGGTTLIGPNLTLNASSNLYWNQTGTLAGIATSFASNANLYIGTGSTLTLSVPASASGDISIYGSGTGSTFVNQGNITHNVATYGYVYAPTFTNSGNITASNLNGYSLTLGNSGYSFTNLGTVTSSGANTYTDLQSVANLGTLTATNAGILRFYGNNTTANLGTVELSSGGRALLSSGTLDNTGSSLGTISGGTFELAGATVSNGTITALAFTGSGGTVNNATFTGNVNFASNSYVTFGNGTTLNNATVTFGGNANIYIASGATVTFDSGTAVTGDISLSGSGTGTTFINQGAITHNIASYGSIYAPTFTNTGAITASNLNGYSLQLGTIGYTFTNTGTITSSGTNTYLDLYDINNQGTVTATNSGILRFYGNNTTAKLGTVQLTSGGRALLGGTLDNTGATLGSVSGGTYELSGGTINNGIISALAFTGSGGTVNNATFTGNVNFASSSYVTFGNGTTLNNATATFGSNANIYVPSNATVTFDSGTTATGDISIYGSGSGSTFVNAGSITHNTATYAYIYTPAFTNTGSITASNLNSYYLQLGTTGYAFTNTGFVNATGTNTYINLYDVDNQGTLTASNSGELRFYGNNTTAKLGTVQLSSGGRALLGGTLDNTGATLGSVSGGTYELYGGTITNGTIAALAFTNYGGTVNNATFTGTVNFAANSYVTLGDGTTLNNATATYGSNANVYITSGATVTFDSGTTATGDISIYGSSSGSTFINQGNLTHNAATYGYVYAPTFTNSGNITASNLNGYTFQLGTNGYTFTNTGSVTVTGTNTYLDLYDINNQGTLSATNAGILHFYGNNTTAKLGTVQLTSGGRALLGGTLDNTGATLGSVSGGTYELYGGTINNGTIAALAFTNYGGTVNNATFTGTVNFAANSYVTFGDGSTPTSTTFNNVTGTFGNNANAYLNSDATLTFDSGTTLTGDISLYGSGSGATLINQGSITQNIATYGYLYAPTFTNAGSITASNLNGYYLSLGTTGYTFTNTTAGNITASGPSTYIYLYDLDNHGTLTATGGGELRLQANSQNNTTGKIIVNDASSFVRLNSSGASFTNAGTIQIQQGTFDTAGTTLVNNPGGLIKGAGKLVGDLTLDGGTLSPGNSIGTLQIANSDFLVTASSTLAVELDATSSDLLAFQNPTSAVALGNGLLNLSITLLSAPSTTSTYTLLSIASGSYGYTGYFAGLPAGSSEFATSFSGTPFYGTVGYQANAITLNFSAVPEPSTYALLFTGLGCLLIRYRRELRARLRR